MAVEANAEARVPNAVLAVGARADDTDRDRMVGLEGVLRDEARAASRSTPPSSPGTRHEQRRRRHGRSPRRLELVEHRERVDLGREVRSRILLFVERGEEPADRQLAQLARRDDGVMDEAGVGPRCSEETGGEIERPRALRCAERRRCDLDLDGRERRALQAGPRSGDHTRHTGGTSPLYETAISARTGREQILLWGAP